MGAAEAALFLLLYVPALRSDRKRLRDGITRYIIGGRLPVCAQCDYDLRGTTGDTCPECGSVVVFRPVSC